MSQVADISCRKYPRQFLLGPARIVDGRTSWNTIELGAGMVVSAHPDLSAAVAEHGESRAVLLGYALDPQNPTRTEQDSLECNLRNAHSADEAIQGTDRWSGRWIAIFRIGDSLRLVPDAAGLRSVFYYAGKKGVFCASQPGLIAEIIGLSKDPDSRSYASSPAYKRNDGWWFGDSSPYAEVRRLLPNHYLDLNTGRVSRFWPSAPLERVDYETALAQGSELLTGTWDAAIRRFGRVALPVTAGLDSRVLLACSRKHAENIFYFVSMHAPLSEQSADVYVPARLAEELGFQFHRLPCTDTTLAPHREAFLADNPMARDDRLHMLYTKYAGWPRDCRVVATGNGNEITRGSYQGMLSHVSPENLSVVFCLEKHPFVIRHVGPWLEEAGPVCRRCSLPILDLFYWEQRMGCWGSQAFLEADCDHETLAPFNCRQYLTLILSVDARYRREPKSVLFRDLAQRNWPGCMSQPINPVEGATLRQKLKGWASRKRWIIRWRNQLRTWSTRG